MPEPESPRTYIYYDDRFAGGLAAKVVITGDVITDAAPILRKFIGQPAGNLHRFLRYYIRKDITDMITAEPFFV